MFEKNNIMNLYLKIYNKQYMLGKGLNKKKISQKVGKVQKGGEWISVKNEKVNNS